jgi:ABC-type glycerol-3-phosphate transport system permease component
LAYYLAGGAAGSLSNLLNSWNDLLWPLIVIDNPHLHALASTGSK